MAYRNIDNVLNFVISKFSINHIDINIDLKYNHNSNSTINLNISLETSTTKEKENINNILNDVVYNLDNKFFTDIYSLDKAENKIQLIIIVFNINFEFVNNFITNNLSSYKLIYDYGVNDENKNVNYIRIKYIGNVNDEFLFKNQFNNIYKRLLEIKEIKNVIKIYTSEKYIYRLEMIE